MRTSQINPQIAINALMGYLGTYNYSGYNFIHNTYDNNVMYPIRKIPLSL